MLKRWEFWVLVLTVVGVGALVYLYYNPKDDKEQKDNASPKSNGQLPKPVSTDNVPNHKYENNETLLEAIEVYNKTDVSEMPNSPNFGFSEFWTRDASYNRYPPPKEYWANVQNIMDQLEIIRAETGNHPIKINSGVRSLWHNSVVGGVTHSYHRVGKAADITIIGADTPTAQDTIQRLRDNGILKIDGIGKGIGWTHIDTRGRKGEWSYNH